LWDVSMGDSTEDESIANGDEEEGEEIAET
jgi:hypothetical protein